MKILHAITLADLGGAQSVLINICNKAAEEGHQVYVVSEAYGPMWEQLDSRITQIKIDKLQREISPLKDLLTLLKLKSINRRIKPDVIHLHSSKIGFLGRLAFPRKKIIYTVHGFDSIRVGNKKFLALEKVLKNKARFIVAVSNYDKEMLLSEGITKNVKMIYNGINDCLQTNTLEYDITASNYLADLQKKHTVLMVISRISPQKEYGLFCEIADHFITDNRFHFVWIGNKAAIGNNTSNVTMMGELINASIYLKYADLFLLPSNYEGLPISILEALCCKIPVIASNVGGVPEILNSKNGFAVQNNVLDFENAIKEIIKSKEVYKSYQDEARITYEQKFTIHTMYEQYMNLYKGCQRQSL